VNKYTIGPDVDLDQEDIRTESGDRLTEAVAEEMAQSALRALRAGRPSLSGAGAHSPQLSTRVPADLKDRARRQAKQEGLSLSRLLRKALEFYLRSAAGSGRQGAGR
jgi:hypothetical protein